jgi:hypothetical protein
MSWPCSTPFRSLGAILAIAHEAWNDLVCSRFMLPPLKIPHPAAHGRHLLPSERAVVFARAARATLILSERAAGSFSCFRAPVDPTLFSGSGRSAPRARRPVLLLSGEGARGTRSDAVAGRLRGRPLTGQRWQFATTSRGVQKRRRVAALRNFRALETNFWHCGKRIVWRAAARCRFLLSPSLLGLRPEARFRPTSR